MAWTGTKSKLLTGMAAATVILGAVAVKWMFFPSVKDSFFAMNQRSLGNVPFGLVVVRTTHFPKSAHTGVMWASAPRRGKPVWRMMGRNVPLQELIGQAYGTSADRVVLPVTTPKTNFDFLVTTTGDQRESLKTAIRKELGFEARTEKRYTAVFALRATEACQTVLTVSAADAHESEKFSDGKLHLTHLRIHELAQGLEQVAKLPVVDKTDLTNYYDFAIDWGPQMQRQLQSEATAQAALTKILGELGLVMEPDEDLTEMLVVSSTR